MELLFFFVRYLVPKLILMASEAIAGNITLVVIVLRLPILAYNSNIFNMFNIESCASCLLTDNKAWFLFPMHV